MHSPAPPTPVPSPGRSYLLHTAILMAIYVSIHLAAILGVFDGMLGQPAGWGVALLLALTVAGQIRATLRLMAQSDEYLRAIIAKCFILASGATLALWTAWGFGETYAAAPHLPGWLCYPFFWAAYALVAPFVRQSR